jgi:hypothetical protein
MELLNQNLEQEEETAQMVGQSASQLLQMAVKTAEMIPRREVSTSDKAAETSGS